MKRAERYKVRYISRYVHSAISLPLTDNRMSAGYGLEVEGPTIVTKLYIVTLQESVIPGGKELVGT